MLNSQPQIQLLSQKATSTSSSSITDIFYFDDLSTALQEQATSCQNGSPSSFAAVQQQFNQQTEKQLNFQHQYQPKLSTFGE
uniref:Uncharacterized protein n=1 Tax=Phlebotomus papatasi TaxID=29031 RepID=A0A1B0DIZ5_PHLPP